MKLIVKIDIDISGMREKDRKDYINELQVGKPHGAFDAFCEKCGKVVIDEVDLKKCCMEDSFYEFELVGIELNEKDM